MFALVLLIGFIGLHWKLLLLIAGVVVLARWGRQGWARQQNAADAERARLAAIAARADTQHAEVMSGDEHGVYGDSWAAMQEFRDVA